jgi:hypothetical protein
MLTNSEARQRATRYGGISIIPYRQAEGNCDGIVSWWLRSRLQDKEIWRPKYFETVAEGRQIATDHYNMDTGILERTDRGLEKARELQNLFYNTNADHAYITRGIRSDKNREEKRVGEYVRTENTQPINDFSTRGDNAGNLCRSFTQCSLDHYAAKYTIQTSGLGHALGLDVLAWPTVRYFDPNIGEFNFPNVTSLIAWWLYCYQNRETGGSAFATMSGNTFNANFYRRVPPVST